MASVAINRGAIEATDFLTEIPEAEWRSLLAARRSFVKTHLPYDCRQLIRFAEEAERMCVPLGFDSAKDLLRRGLEIDPELVDWAIEGLRALDPSEPVALEAAVAVGKAQALAADPEVKPLGPAAPEKGEARNPSGRNQHLEVDSVSIEPNPDNGGRRGTGAEYLVRRLKRDAPEVAAELARGELPSARAAAIKAGIVRVPSKVERAFRLVERMTTAERLDFDRQIRPLIEAAEGS